MKRSPYFMESKIAGKYILVPVGKMTATFHGVISLSEMGAVIWELLKEDTTEEKILQCVLREYDVTENQAKGDIARFISSLRENNCIIE